MSHTVHKARQLGLNRTVALKMLRHSNNFTSAELNRFRLEAEAAALLCHSGIVQVYDIGEQEGQPYLAMEFVPGVSLAKWLAGRAVAGTVAAHIVVQIADAVHYAHTQGIIHRDLKPANILVASNDPLVLKVADFGLAKRMDGVGGQTETGVILGTPSYMAPEQARGQVNATDRRTDVYALGAILYELLTGTPPFTGTTPLEILAKVERSEPTSPREIASTVPRDLEVACLKCLDKDKRFRYDTANDLAVDMRRFLAGEPIAAHPAGRMRRAIQWTQRHPAHATGTLALLILMTAGVMAWVWHLHEMRQQIIRTNIVEHDAEKQRLQSLEDFRRGHDAVDELLRQAERQGRELGLSVNLNSPRRASWELALGFFRGVLDGADTTDPRFRLAKAIAKNYSGIGEQMLGDTESARKTLSEARASLEQLVELTSGTRLNWPVGTTDEQIPFDPSYQLARCHLWLGQIDCRSDPQMAIHNYQQSVSILRKLVEQQPTSVRIREKLADGLAALADVYLALNSLPEVNTYSLAAIAEYEPLIARDPSSEYLCVRWSILSRLCVICQFDRQQFDDAFESLERAQLFMRQFLEMKPSHAEGLAELAELHRLQAMALRHRNHTARAIAELQQGIELLSSIAVTDSRYPITREVLAALNLDLTNATATLERPEAAEQSATKSSTPVAAQP